MGRFTKRVGSFDSPHSVEDTLEVLFNGVAEQLSTPSPTVSMPGVEAAVYLSRFDTTGVTVAAGNRSTRTSRSTSTSRPPPAAASARRTSTGGWERSTAGWATPGPDGRPVAGIPAVQCAHPRLDNRLTRRNDER